MIFTSISFALFFLIVAIINYAIPIRFRWVPLLIASIFFYMCSNPVYIIIMALIIGITYYAGIKTNESEKFQAFYAGAIIINIALLVFFKYTNFFTNTGVYFINYLNHNLFHSNKTFNNSLLVNIVAPLGISYVTFQAIGYLIEIKRGNQIAEKHLGYFATFMLFFPKIIAGPVERAHNFLPQLKNTQNYKYDNISIGVKQIIWGLFKKLVIADRVSIIVGAVFDNAEHHSGISLLMAAILYVFQMYADFSGYTDMALGLAKILGFDLTPNFNLPLLSKSVTEFWRRWHMSLSTWFADYVYGPLSIAKRDWGKWSVVYASFVTFIILGFWHGANWTFIIFGALQGCILTIEHLTRKTRKNIRKKIPVFLNNLLGTAFTFSFYGFSLIFFRAENVQKALIIIKRIFTIKGPLYTQNPTMLIFSFLGILFLLMSELKKEYFNSLFTISSSKNWIVSNGYYCFLIIVILIAGVFDGGEFIYFQF